MATIDPDGWFIDPETAPERRKYLISPRPTTAKDLQGRWSGFRDARMFRCHLCGKRFAEGDIYAAIYAPSPAGNAVICERCDGPDVVERWLQRVRHIQAEAWWLWERACRED
jgi:hypothetical protein